MEPANRKSKTISGNKKTVCSEKLEELFDTRADMRETVRNQIYQKLSQTIGQEFDTSLFYDSVRDIDNRLLEDSEASVPKLFKNRLQKNWDAGKINLACKKEKFKIINDTGNHLSLIFMCKII